jgi:hypothetical protein
MASHPGMPCKLALTPIHSDSRSEDTLAGLPTVPRSQRLTGYCPTARHVRVVENEVVLLQVLDIERLDLVVVESAAEDRPDAGVHHFITDRVSRNRTFLADLPNSSSTRSQFSSWIDVLPFLGIEPGHRHTDGKVAFQHCLHRATPLWPEPPRPPACGCPVAESSA